VDVFSRNVEENEKVQAGESVSCGFCGVKLCHFASWCYARWSSRYLENSTRNYMLEIKAAAVNLRKMSVTRIAPYYYRS